MRNILAYWKSDSVIRAMGVSFQGGNHCSGDRGTAPKSNIIMVAAPQRKVAGTSGLLCASIGSPELLAWGR